MSCKKITVYTGQQTPTRVDAHKIAELAGGKYSEKDWGWEPKQGSYFVNVTNVSKSPDEITSGLNKISMVKHWTCND